MKYKILVSDSLISEKQLNGMFVEGWELVTIVQYGGRYFSYFKHIEKE